MSENRLVGLVEYLVSSDSGESAESLKRSAPAKSKVFPLTLIAELARKGAYADETVDTIEDLRFTTEEVSFPGDGGAGGDEKAKEK